MQGFADYGDIIKSVLTHCLRYNIANKLYEWSHVVVQTLKSEFELLQEEGGQLSYGSEAYMSLKVWRLVYFCAISDFYLEYPPSGSTGGFPS